MCVCVCMCVCMCMRMRLCMRVWVRILVIPHTYLFCCCAGSCGPLTKALPGNTDLGPVPAGAQAVTHEVPQAVTHGACLHRLNV